MYTTDEAKLKEASEAAGKALKGRKRTGWVSTFYPKKEINESYKHTAACFEAFFNHAKCSALTACPQRCPQTQRLHWQVAFQIKDGGMKYGEVLDDMNECDLRSWVRPMGAQNPLVAFRYCTAEQWCKECHSDVCLHENDPKHKLENKGSLQKDYPAIELGKVAANGQRPEYQAFLSDIKEAKNKLQIYEGNPYMALRGASHSAWSEYYKLTHSDQPEQMERDISIKYYYGAPGRGKTTYIHNVLHQTGTPYYCIQSNHPSTSMWDTYRGQKVLIIDEFQRCTLDWGFVNKIFDRQKWALHQRYNTVPVYSEWTEIILIGHDPLDNVEFDRFPADVISRIQSQTQLQGTVKRSREVPHTAPIDMDKKLKISN